MLNNIDKIYVCHYTPLEDRLLVLDNMLSNMNLDYEIISEYDRENLDEETLSPYIKIKDNLNIPGHTHRTLRMSEISLILKHHDIIRKMVNEKINNVLVLEDDVIFEDDFVNKFNEYTKELPICYDLLWVGTCCGIKSRNITDNKYIYKENGSRCTHAYMISYKCAKKIYDLIYNLNYPADFMYNHLIDTLKLENYWLEPSLINQNPIWDTTIQNDKNFIK